MRILYLVGSVDGLPWFVYCFSDCLSRNVRHFARGIKEHMVTTCRTATDESVITAVSFFKRDQVASRMNGLPFYCALCFSASLIIRRRRPVLGIRAAPSLNVRVFSLIIKFDCKRNVSLNIFFLCRIVETNRSNKDGFPKCFNEIGTLREVG